MKTFTNKPTEIKVGEKTADYIELSIACLESRDPQAGLTIEDMGARLELIGKLRERQKAGGTEPALVELEDAEANRLMKQLAFMDGRWLMMHADIVTFYADMCRELA